MATLNLPATTSGIWRAPAPPAWVPPALQPLALAPAAPPPLADGVEPQAPTTIAAVAKRLANRSRVLVMESPPPRRTWVARAPSRHARARPTGRSPGSAGSERKDSRPANVGGGVAR